MAAATLSNFIFFFSPSASAPCSPSPVAKSFPPLIPTHHNLSLSLLLPSSSNRPTTRGRGRGCLAAQVFSVDNPVLDDADFSSEKYNVEIIVEDDEPEERLLGRFRREVMRAGIIQEARRRRFFENPQEEKKRRNRDAAKRNRRRRQNSRFTPQDKPDEAPPTTTNKEEDDNDNWDLPAGDVPYLN